MTAQPSGGGTRGGRPQLAVLLVFAIGAIPLLVVLAAWLRGDRTDISLDIPRACSAVDAAAVAQLTPGGTPAAKRSVGTSTATDSCAVHTETADLDVTVGADPQRYSAAYRTSHCSAIGATPTTSGSSVTCATTRTGSTPARVDEYVWVGGVYEVRMGYERTTATALDAATTATTDRIVATLVPGLPGR